MVNSIIYSGIRFPDGHFVRFPHGNDDHPKDAPRAPKKIEKNSLFFISVDEFSKLICCFLFSLIFSTNSTNQRNQRNEFNESTNKIFVDFTKFQRIFNENFNESTKILKKSSNSLKFCSKLVDALKIAIDFS